MFNRIIYWKRIFSSYFLQSKSNLSFWHGSPEVNRNSKLDQIGQYYMSFHYKADYDGEHDNLGIPMLNYHGDIGLQYNPIAISQWGLGNYNLWKDTDSDQRYNNFIKVADWLVDNLNQNSNGLYVWTHEFDWVYKQKLEKPWYSGLAQGQGLSVLTRAYYETKNKEYLDASKKVYDSFLVNVENGGVTDIDANKNLWIEEYIVNQPTHILNGFIWGLRGIYDYWLLTGDKDIKYRFDKYVKTIKLNIYKYDIGYWSLYELSNLKIKMRSSIFYHRLHIVQLKILYNMTNIEIFDKVSTKWNNYMTSKKNIYKATFMKILFKIFYY